MNHIKNILIFKLINKYKYFRDLYGHSGFFYLDKKVSSIDRIGHGLLYEWEKIPPTDWSKVNGQDLYAIFKQLNSNRFYFYKNIDGKFYKTRPKKLKC